ncbi:MAG: RNA chaperone Hfq [Clostridiales bacterium]|nr:RNA chaperone Hfq [Clostridiales bacterium]MCF8021100.1 RNA chaperone Hfq [Clostridiales bacterium]
MQDNFLNRVRKAQTPVTVYLVNGVQLKGVVTGFDTFSLTLDSNNKQQMIYKHAISTISPEQVL